MSWDFLWTAIRTALMAGVLLTGIAFAALYVSEGETDAWGERVGPPKALGVFFSFLLGLLVWAPLYGILFSG